MSVSSRRRRLGSELRPRDPGQQLLPPGPGRRRGEEEEENQREEEGEEEQGEEERRGFWRRPGEETQKEGLWDLTVGGFTVKYPTRSSWKCRNRCPTFSCLTVNK